MAGEWTLKTGRHLTPDKSQDSQTNESSSGRPLLQHQLDLLAKELDLIDAAIRQMDDITKGIKNWSIVTWTASVGVGLSNEKLIPFMWITAAIPLLFWVVDATYRRVQRSFILRQREIGKFFNSKEFATHVSRDIPLTFPVLRMRTGSPHWKNQLIGVMLFRTVAPLYLGLSALSMVVWVVAR